MPFLASKLHKLSNAMILAFVISAICSPFVFAGPGNTPKTPPATSDNTNDLSQITKQEAVQPRDVAGSVPRSIEEIGFTAMFLVFGLVVLLILKNSLPPDRTNIDITRVYGGPLIIVGSLVLISASISTEASAPAFGLFGTIAGYILGKNARESGGAEGSPTSGKQSAP